MAPTTLKQIVQHVDKSRRRFLMQALAGTTFAAPLMASFPLHASAVAQRGDLCHIFVSNMTHTPMWLTPRSTSPYFGATRFRAVLVNSLRRRVGEARFELNRDHSELLYHVAFDNAHHRIASTVLNDTVVPGIVLFVNESCFLVLSLGGGSLGTPPPGCSGNDVLEAMSSGDACVFALTTRALYEGSVMPVGALEK